MALFKSADEFQKIVRMDKGIDIAKLLPHIEDAEEQWIIPAISEDQYEELHTDYQDAVTPATDMVPALYALLIKIQKSLAQLAMTHYIYKENIQKNNGGINMRSSNESKQAFQWMVDDANWAYAQTGFRRLDSVLTYMENNKGNYSTWVNSDAYTITKKFYINTTKQFHQIFHISESRRLFMKLWPDMQSIEDQVIAEAIGEDFHNELKAAILADTVTADQLVLIEKIQKAVGHLTISKGLDNLFVDINERGLLMIGTGSISSNSRKADPVRDTILGKMISDARTTGNTYLKNVVEHLNKNASEALFSTYFESDLYEDPDAEDSSSNSDDTTLIM